MTLLFIVFFVVVVICLSSLRFKADKDTKNAVVGPRGIGKGRGRNGPTDVTLGYAI